MKKNIVSLLGLFALFAVTSLHAGDVPLLWTNFPTTNQSFINGAQNSGIVATDGLGHFGTISSGGLFGSFPITLGTNTPVNPTVNGALVIERLVNGGSAHGVSDNSTVTGSFVGLGYASIDSNDYINPTTAEDHFVAFQDRSQYASASTLTNWYSFTSGSNNVGGGTITNMYGFYKFAATNTGTINNYYAFYDATPAAVGNTLNYGVYIQFNPSYFGGTITTAGRVVSNNPAGTGSGIGYTTGAGASVTQLTSKSTGVTSNTITGQITMNAASLAANTTVAFVLSDTALGGDDVMNVSASGTTGTTAGSYMVSATNNANFTSTITVYNVSAGALAEAVIIKYAIIKGSHN